MFKGLMLRALVNERLNAAADDVFALFEKTIAEYEEELCRSKEENQKKQRLLDFLCPKVRGGVQITSACSGSDQNQEIAETSSIKEEPEELGVTHAEEQLPVPAPEFSAVCVKSEQSSLLRGQTEHRKETQGEDISRHPHSHSETEGQTDNSSETDNDDSWRLPIDCSATTNSVLSPLNKSARETCVSVNNEDMPDSEKGLEGKKHQCSVCKTRFKRKEHLRIHSRVHTGERPYSCTMCNKSFTVMTLLKAHMRSHTGEKPFRCLICEKDFAEQRHLKSHVRTHTGEKPFSCSLCNKTFRRVPHLKRHKRTHTGEKPYTCSICDKTFSDNASLKAHIRTHTGEKPYSCSICDKTFAQNCNLKKHLRTHTGEKPYVCLFCDKGFASLRSLKKHENIHKT